MLNQFIREPSYYIVGFVWKLRGCCRSKKSKPPVLTNEPKQISSSSKTVLFIRHGQGDHNASLPGWNLVDPPLNATGLGQARDLHERLGGTSGPLKDVEVVLVSPLTRAFQTAQGAFGHGPAFQNREPTLKPKWVVCPLLRERMGAPCDEGRPKAQLAMTMPEMKEMEGFDTMKPDVWWTPHFEFGLYDRIAELEEQARGAAPLASRTAPLTAPLAASLPRSPPSPLLSARLPACRSSRAPSRRSPWSGTAASSRASWATTSTTAATSGPRGMRTKRRPALRRPQQRSEPWAAERAGAAVRGRPRPTATGGSSHRSILCVRHYCLRGVSQLPRRRSAAACPVCPVHTITGHCR